tara:strand:- start:5727 stop:5969 length:243 start_codon:yes stop_codon:yes gene_type:complete
MTPKQRDQAVLRIQNQLIEEVSADAVLIVYSRTNRRGTKVFMTAWGNDLACEGLAKHAFAHYVEMETEEIEEEEEEETDE